MSGYQLGIEGGTVVTAQGRHRLNVYVAEGRVAAVTAQKYQAQEVVDASDLLVMPGMVDAHVHFMDPADTTREDFPTATAAAVRAGVTTVVEHSHGRPLRTSDDLREKVVYLSDRSRVDFALAAHAWPGFAADVAPAWAAGVAFVKAFTCTTHGVPGHDLAHLQELFEAAAACGATCLLHCEDESLTAAAEIRLHEAGRQDGSVISAWRSRESEQVAVASAAILAAAAGARTVLAHASHLAVIELAQGLVIESCPQYLTLFETEASEVGPLRKFTPPARARSDADLAAMWQALADGRIDYISTDHAPATLDQKAAGSIWDVHFGLPGIDTTLSILLDGAHRGLITYERVVAVYSEAPARLYGLRGKGGLEAGFDADIVLVDPVATWAVAHADIRSKAGWSPYAGRTLRGRAVRTYLRGRLAADGDRVLAKPGWGQFLRGPGAHPPNVSESGYL